MGVRRSVLDLRYWYVPLLVLACGLIYLLATPLDGSGDEDSHLIRMIGLSRGHLLGSDVPADRPYGGFSGSKLAAINHEAGSFWVPADIEPLLECTRYQQPREPWTCPRLQRRTSSAEHVSHHARVLPTTYLLPAVLSRAAGGTAGKFYLGRLGFLLQNVLLVVITTTAVRCAKFRWSGLTTGATVLACTPVLLWQTGLIAPSSTENFAYIAFVAAATAAVRLPTSRWWIGATSLGVIATLCRDLGFVFMPGLLVAMLALSRRRAPVTRLHVRARLISLVALGGACLTGLVWRLRFQSRTSGVEVSAQSVGAAARRLGSLSLDAVARLGWLDIPTQRVAGLMWILAFVGVWGALVLQSSHWARVVGLAAGVWCVTNIVLILVISAKGFTWFGTQARYTAFVPVCFLIIGLAATRDDSSQPTVGGPAAERLLAWFSCSVAALAHLITFFHTSHRWANGLSHSMSFRAAVWSPPGGWAPMIFSALITSVCLAVLPAVVFSGRPLAVTNVEHSSDAVDPRLS